MTLDLNNTGELYKAIFTGKDHNTITLSDIWKSVAAAVKSDGAFTIDQERTQDKLLTLTAKSGAYFKVMPSSVHTGQLKILETGKGGTTSEGCTTMDAAERLIDFIQKIKNPTP